MLDTHRSADGQRPRPPNPPLGPYAEPATAPPSYSAPWPLSSRDLSLPLQADPGLQMSLANGPVDRAEAQHLRYLVFAQELGAQIGSQTLAIDQDEFDEVCDHLLVRDLRSGRVVGTYRILAPHRRAQLGRYYADAEFDLSSLAHLQPSMVEVGRSCVHPDHRSGAVLLMLWTGLTQYMRKAGYAHLIGCASASLADGGPQAVALRDRLQAHLVAPPYRAFPRIPYPHELITRATHPVMPPLIKGYLRLGAKVCGEPAWDQQFNCADFLIWLALSDMQPRYARRLKLFGAAQAPSATESARMPAPSLSLA